MGIRIVVNGTANIQAQQPPPSRRGVRILAGVVLLAAAMLLLWVNRGFILYAATGFFWSDAQGTVVEASINSVPTVQFTASDGAIHSFSEDYIILCQSRRTLCWPRDFTLGEQVPVVYDPQKPDRAYIHDWALTATVITVFFEGGLGLILMLMLAVAVSGKPVERSIQIGNSVDVSE